MKFFHLTVSLVLMLFLGLLIGCDTGHNSGDRGGFSEINPDSLTDVSSGSIDLGDIDDDGDLDLILTGTKGARVSEIYTNDGSGSFTEINAGSLTSVRDSSVDLGDLDGDGDLDLVLTGAPGGNSTSEIYENDSGSFTEINSGDLTGVQRSSIDLGDLDGDDAPDLILTGGDVMSMPISKIYRNDGSGSFTEINAGSLTGVRDSSVDLGDLDGDGDLDLVLTGDGATSMPISKIYRNDGSGGFTEINSGSLTGVRDSSVDLGDLDGDSDLDLVLTGDDATATPISKIYRNDGSGGFTEINSGSLTGVRDSSVDLGDLDGDSDLDLVLTGIDATSTPVSKIYNNDGIGGFTETDSGSLTGVLYSSVDLGDLDGDGALDLVLTGQGDSTQYSQIYRNDWNSGGYPANSIGED
jgi:hypothetical protein